MEQEQTPQIITSEPESAPAKDIFLAPKKPKGLIIATAAASVIALASVAFTIVTLIKADKKSAEISELAAKVDLLQQETGTQLVEKEENGTTITVVEPADTVDIFSVKDAEVRAIVADVKTVLDPIAAAAGITAESNSEFIVSTKIEGLKVATALDKAYGVRYVSPDTQLGHTLYEKSVEKLKNLGFTENEKIQSLYGSFVSTFVNSENIICETVDNTAPFAVECGYYKWVSNENITLLNQLAEAVKKKKGDYPDYISIDKENRLKNSSVNPYQTFLAHSLGAALLFYRTSPDAEWQYFTGTQGELPCSDYNTDDLKKAYTGERCYDETTWAESTVKL